MFRGWSPPRPAPRSLAATATHLQRANQEIINLKKINSHLTNLWAVEVFKNVEVFKSALVILKKNQFNLFLFDSEQQPLSEVSVGLFLILVMSTKRMRYEMFLELL